MSAVQKALNKRTLFLKDSAEVGVETSPQTQNLPKGLETVQKFLLVCWRLILELSQNLASYKTVSSIVCNYLSWVKVSL